MTLKIKSPHPFAERFLLFGGGGVGKSNTALNIIQHCSVGKMAVVDSDYSGTYDRALSTDYTDCTERVTVFSGDPDWQSFITSATEAVTLLDPETDWLVLDPAGNSYDWVQAWVMEQIHGNDLAKMLMDLKRTYLNDDKGYQRAKSELMNWDLVKSEYGKFWRLIQRWKGHMILVAEAKPVSNREKDAEIKMLYGPLGFMPAGQATLKHVASTTLFLDHPKRGEWRVTTIKDRNRRELDKEPIDNFAIDYMQQVAGWELDLPKPSGLSKKLPAKKVAAKKLPAKKVAAVKAVAETRDTSEDSAEVTTDDWSEE